MLAPKEAFHKSSRPFSIKRLECVGQPYSYTTVMKCNLESPRQGPQIVNIAVSVNQPVTKLYVSTNVYIKHRQSLTFVYGTTFEYCEFLMRNQSRQTNPVAVIVYNYAKHNFPQVLRPCPFSGFFNVTGLPVDKNLIPPFVTPGGYLGYQRMFSKRNETLLQYEAEFFIFLKRFQCTGYPYEISRLHYCHLETFRNGTQVAGVVIQILNNVHKVNVQSGMYIQYLRTRTMLLATTMEYCHQSKDLVSIENPTNKFALNYAQQHLPQLLTDCPIRAGAWFNITGMRISDSLIPSFAVPATYYVELRIYNRRNQTVFSGWLEAEPLVIKRLDCTDEKSKISTLLLSQLTTPRNGPQIVDVLLDIVEPTSKLLIIFNLYTQYLQTKTLLYGTTFEYCDLMKNLNTQINPVTVIALSVARENFPQVLQQCPFYGLVNVTGLQVNNKLIPPYAPHGTYYFSIRASNKRNQTIVGCTSEFYIVQQALFTRTLSMLG
uniref:Uncharacterized protein n=1 Tax=Anopheles epiroticus TaxID=199890 RepID=A0A182PD45_9DIPT